MIKFYNIKTGEERVCETEPMIAAFWASSDRGPNSNAGQDFGWRLAPETLLEIKKLQQDPEVIRNIAVTYQMIPEEVRESDVLKWISDRSQPNATGMDQTSEDFERKYEDQIRAIQTQADKSEEKATTNSNKKGSSNAKK